MKKKQTSSVEEETIHRILMYYKFKKACQRRLVSSELCCVHFLYLLGKCGDLILLFMVQIKPPPSHLLHQLMKFAEIYTYIHLSLSLKLPSFPSKYVGLFHTCPSILLSLFSCSFVHRVGFNSSYLNSNLNSDKSSWNQTLNLCMKTS